MTFQYHNCPQDLPPPPSPLPDGFSLNTPPGTDIWRKPPAHDAFDAPICYRVLKLSTFRRARVTVSADWKTKFDQGGLCLILPQKDQRPTKWVKTGIEMYNGLPNVSTVACDRWADWSLVPLTGTTTATVEMEREVKDGELTSTLWIYMVDGEERRPLREVSWVFESEEGNDGDAGVDDCWVGVYAAKPTKDEGDESHHLQVIFDQVHVETA